MQFMEIGAEMGFPQEQVMKERCAAFNAAFNAGITPWGLCNAIDRAKKMSHQQQQQQQPSLSDPSLGGAPPPLTLAHR